MDFTYDDNTFSDLHKEVHGWRPSNSLMVEWNERTPRQKQELWNALCDQLEDVMAEEKAAHERKLAAFEKFVEYNMRLGASTRRDAIRWIFDAEDISFDDPGYACWLFGLPYNPYEDEFRSIKLENMGIIFK